MVLLAYIMFENNRFKSDNTIMSYSNNFTDNQIDTIFENRFTKHIKHDFLGKYNDGSLGAKVNSDIEIKFKKIQINRKDYYLVDYMWNRFSTHINGVRNTENIEVLLAILFMKYIR
ncbi:MAG: hypothetical protein ACI94Y_004488 [Maribacter sp.]|jgi:hypothetical protein